MSFEVELTLLIESASAELAEEAVDAVLAAVRPEFEELGPDTVSPAPPQSPPEQERT